MRSTPLPSSSSGRARRSGLAPRRVPWDLPLSNAAGKPGAPVHLLSPRGPPRSCAGSESTRPDGSHCRPEEHKENLSRHVAYPVLCQCPKVIARSEKPGPRQDPDSFASLFQTLAFIITDGITPLPLQSTGPSAQRSRIPSTGCPPGLPGIRLVARGKSGSSSHRFRWSAPLAGNTTEIHVQSSGQGRG